MLGWDDHGKYPIPGFQDFQGQRKTSIPDRNSWGNIGFVTFIGLEAGASISVGATTGRACRIMNPPPMVIVRSVALLRPNKSVIDPRFLEYALESSECQSQIWESVKQAAQPCLYIHRMKELSIPVPPLPGQRRIVAYLDSLQEKGDELKSFPNIEIFSLADFRQIVKNRHI